MPEQHTSFQHGQQAPAPDTDNFSTVVGTNTVMHCQQSTPGNAMNQTWLVVNPLEAWHC